MASVNPNPIGSGASASAVGRELRRRLRDAAHAEIVLPACWDALGAASLRIDESQPRPAAPAYLRRAALAMVLIREETPMTLADDLLQIGAEWADMSTPLAETPAPPLRRLSARRVPQEGTVGQIPRQDSVKSTEKDIESDTTRTGNRGDHDEASRSDSAADPVAVLPMRSSPRRFVQSRYHELRNEVLASLKTDDAACLGLIDVDDEESTLELYAGLATALCDAQEPATPVLLMDASLADRRLSRSFASANLPGLGEHVLEQAELQSLIVPTSLHGVSLLPGGGKRPRELKDVPEATWKELITDLKQRFKYILIEFSAESTLPGTLSAHLDAVHLCLRLNRSPRVRVNQLVRRLQRDGIRNLGCLLADLPRAA